ncbi:hypothetical protein CSC43_7154 [Pseudomonas aeruginosa]|nr:hypothetical protein CSC26_7006 [Pseudomonas aeruginosa]RCH25472.1 hypothetical protein CSC43_7154 [Pseudomonas aeruginosa]
MGAQRGVGHLIERVKQRLDLLSLDAKNCILQIAHIRSFGQILQY